MQGGEESRLPNHAKEIRNSQPAWHSKAMRFGNLRESEVIACDSGDCDNASLA